MVPTFTSCEVAKAEETENRLRQMGFKEDEHTLLQLLDKYNDSIEGVLGELLT